MVGFIMGEVIASALGNHVGLGFNRELGAFLYHFEWDIGVA